MKKLLWLSILSLVFVGSMSAKGETCGVMEQPSFQCPPCPVPAEVTCEYIPGSFLPAEFCQAQFTPATFKQAQYCEGSVRRVVHCDEPCAEKKSCKRSCGAKRTCQKCRKCGGSCKYAGTRRAASHAKYIYEAPVESNDAMDTTESMDVDNN